MANAFRGEVRIEIAGKGYDVAMTLDALARMATALQIETLVELEARLQACRISDLTPMLSSLLAGNGHDVPAEDLARVQYKAAMHALIDAYTKRPGADEDAKAEVKADAKASPPKRAA